MPYRRGMILDLKDLGTFQDTELGRISGINSDESYYEYVFFIRENKLFVEGNGQKVPSINTTFNSGQKLSFSQNYPFCGTFTLVDTFFSENTLFFGKKKGAN